VAYDEETLAQDHVSYAPNQRRSMAVTDARLFENRFPSPRPFLWDLSDVAWHLVLRAPPSHRRHRRQGAAVQESLFPPQAESHE